MKNSDNLIKTGIDWAKQRGLLTKGDYVVTTSGHIEAVSGTTNVLKVTLVE